MVGIGEEARRTALTLLQNQRQGLRPCAIVDPSFLGDRLASAQAAGVRTSAVLVGQPALQEAARHLRADSGFAQTFIVLESVGRGIGELWLEPAQCGDQPVLRCRNRLLLPHHRMLKRVFDVVACGLLLLLLLPLLVLLALLVKLTSEGPIFYGHRRLGRHGSRFRAWKFRTMVRNADERLASYLSTHPELRAEWEATQKLRHDPRITWIGRFLRRSSLDELPQLWNVWTGDMSLIGPRPIVDSEVARYGEHFATAYDAVRPGITGLWQVSGRNRTTYERRVHLDSFYVRNWSLWLDTYIAVRTLRTVLFAEGAY